LNPETQQVASATVQSISWLTPWIGPAIIAAIVTFVGQLIVSKLNRSQEKEKEEQLAWTDAVMPVVEACDDVIARFFDIVVRKRPMDFDKFNSAELAKQDPLRNPAPSLTTVFRLVKFLAGVTYLQRKMPMHGDIKRLRQADLYLSNKIRMALKGNVAGSTLKLQTEAQQCIGSKFLEGTKSLSPHELDFYQFVQILRKDTEACELADLAGSVLRFSSDFSEIKAEQVAFALVLIYMIDVHQDLLESSKWEEFRVFLASVVRTWNAKTGARAIFLYSPSDLSSSDYLDSYARLDFLDEDDAKRRKRIAARQSRGRTISSTGIRKATATKTAELRFADQPGDILNALKSVV
jgi:hypothetical protein